MLGIANIPQISRKCVITLEGGGCKVTATLYIPKPTNPIFYEEMERRFVESFNKSQPNAAHKAVSVHILRN